MILITSLIAVVVLSLAVNFAYTNSSPRQDEFYEESSSVDELVALEEVLEDYLMELETEQDVDDKEYLDIAVTRLEIAKAMMQVSTNSTDIAIKYQGLTIEELLALLDQTYGPNDYPATNSNDENSHIEE